MPIYGSQEKAESDRPVAAIPKWSLFAHCILGDARIAAFRKRSSRDLVNEIVLDVLVDL